MSKKEVVGSMSEWAGMLSDFFRQIKDGSINSKEMQAIIEHQNPFVSENNCNLILADWQTFYRCLGISCDFSNIVIPNDPGGFGRVIIMAQSITPQSAYNLCAKNFSCWKYTDKNLDEVVISDRNAKNGPYAIRVRDGVEADEEFKNLSADDIKVKKIITETLEERLMHELKFFKECGKHLDVTNITLCSGSRDSGGDVPHVHWFGYSSEVSVDRHSSGHAHDHLRAREAVSLSF